MGLDVANTDTPLIMLKERDRALYSACLYMPEDKRDAIACLHMFELETRRVRDLVSEPMPGEIRLQWWRDVLSGERAGEAAANPLAAALLETIERYSLDAMMLERLADARIFDLYDDPMPSIEDFESYCGQTFSTVLQMSAQILGEGAAPSSGNAAGHAGCAMGVATVLTNFYRQRSRGQVFVPQDILSATGTDREGYLSLQQPEIVKNALEAFCSFGENHVKSADKEVKSLPKTYRSAFLPLTFARLDISNALRNPQVYIEGKSTVYPLRQQWALLRMALTL